MNKELLQIGDEVIIDIPNENWNWGYRPVDKQSGTKAIVVGFDEIHYGRTNTFGRKPGVYENRHWINVKVGNADPFSINSCFIQTDKQKYNLDRKDAKFIRNLPNTKFWEGDIVRTNRREENELMIVGIEYHRTPFTYSLSNGFNSGWSMNSHENDITLIRRGNIYKYYNNEPIEFKSVTEEINFYKLLGHYDEIKNPENDMYSWTKDEILSAIEKGIVDGMLLSGLRHIAIKFHDSIIGEKCRQETLKDLILYVKSI